LVTIIGKRKMQATLLEQDIVLATRAFDNSRALPGPATAADIGG
jgi:hypothetical protein